MLMYGTRHAATTTFSRLLFDMRAEHELLFFEPDHPTVWTEWPDFENRITFSDLTQLLRCNATAWGGWPRFSHDSPWAPPRVTYQDCWRYTPFSHCSTSWRPCSGASSCSSYVKSCRSKRVVALKSIELQAILAKHGIPPSWSEPGLVLLHVVRDARGVFTSWLKDELGESMLLGRNATSLLASMAETSRYTPGSAFVQRFGRTVHNICSLWRSHNALLDAWLKQHPTTPYIRVNAESFLGRGIRQEVAIVNRVRTMLGLHEIGRDVKKDIRLRSWMARKPNASLTVFGRKRTKVPWLKHGTNATFGHLPGGLDRTIEDACPEFLHANSKWDITSRGELPRGSLRATSHATASTRKSAALAKGVRRSQRSTKGQGSTTEIQLPPAARISVQPSKAESAAEFTGFKVGDAKAAEAAKKLYEGGLWRFSVHSTGRFLSRHGGLFVSHAKLFSLFTLAPIKRKGISDRVPTTLTQDGKPLTFNSKGRLMIQRYSKTAPRTFVLRRLPGRAERYMIFSNFREEQCLIADDFSNSTLYTGTQSGIQLIILSNRCEDDPRAVFRLEQLASKRSLTSEARAFSLKTRARKAAIKIGSRKVVFASYSNLARVDMAVISWNWLNATGVGKLLLLDLDGKTCAAARRLQNQVRIFCAGEEDLSLPPKLQSGSQEHGLGAGLQEWGTYATDGYFKIMRWKVRLIEVVLTASQDVLLLDIDVMVLSTELLQTFVRGTEDLVISSDERTEDIGNDCPLSPPEHRNMSTKWVCAGLMYMRNSPASLWFLNEAQRLMDDYSLTDQDAIQALLTGYAQVAGPVLPIHMPKVSADARSLARVRADREGGSAWLHDSAFSLKQRNEKQIPVNTRLTETAWKAYQTAKADRGFRVSVVPVGVASNGPVIQAGWNEVYGLASRPPDLPQSVHLNCNTKFLLRRDYNTTSWLFHPHAARTLTKKREVMERDRAAKALPVRRPPGW